MRRTGPGSRIGLRLSGMTASSRDDGVIGVASTQKQILLHKSVSSRDDSWRDLLERFADEPDLEGLIIDAARPSAPAGEPHDHEERLAS